MAHHARSRARGGRDTPHVLSIWTKKSQNGTSWPCNWPGAHVCLLWSYPNGQRPQENRMNFDQWIDSVNDQVHARLGRQVRTEELSWDSAHWVSKAGNAVAALDSNESAATISFDNGEKMS